MACEVGVGQCVDEATGIPVCCPPLFDGPGDPVDTFGRHPECWLAMPGSTASGLGQAVRDLLGCESGCWPCNDLPIQMSTMIQQSEGERWLALDPDSNANANAWGEIRDLPSNFPELIPGAIQYRRGTCWNNDGQECFNTNVCSCYGPNSGLTARLFEDDVLCGGGVMMGDPINGYFPDDLFYNGWAWPMRDGGPYSVPGSFMHCRRFTDSMDRDGLPAHVVIASAASLNRMMLPVMLYTGGPHEAGSLGTPHCSTNALIYCTAETKPSGTCPGAFGNGTDDQFGQHHDPPPYYNTNESRYRYEKVELMENTAHLRTDSPLRPDIDVATVEFKNRVLAHIATQDFPTDRLPMRFDRVDAQWGPNGQLEIGSYVRQWTAAGLADADRPEVQNVFGQCYLLHSGCPVRLRYVLDFVRVTVWLMLQKVNGQSSRYIPDLTIHPHGRARIEAWGKVVADLPGECGLTLPWREEGDPARHTAITVEEREDALPAVVPDVDRIVYVDTNGKKFRPTLKVDWLGYLGYRGASPTTYAQVFRPRTVLDGDDLCDRIANGAEGLRIPGWPYVVEGNEYDRGRADQVYAGHLKLRFPV